MSINKEKLERVKILLTEANGILKTQYQMIAVGVQPEQSMLDKIASGNYNPLEDGNVASKLTQSSDEFAVLGDVINDVGSALGQITDLL